MSSSHLADVLDKWSSYIQEETLSVKLIQADPPSDFYTQAFQIDGVEVILGIKKFE